MSKIIINRQVLEDWIKYIDTFPLYPEDRAKLQSVLKQGEEYNENEAIEFAEWLEKDYFYTVRGKSGWLKDNKGDTFYSTQELYKLYKDARNTEK